MEKETANKCAHEVSFPVIISYYFMLFYANTYGTLGAMQLTQTFF